MSLTPTEEALVRQLLDQQAAILSLAGNESTITSKLGATKVTLAGLVAASSVADADMLLMRQGTTDKSVTGAILKAYTTPKINNAAEAVPGIVELATAAETVTGTDASRATHPAGVLAAIYAALTGQVGFFAMATPPAGWLKADGTAVSRTTYANLFAAIGTTYGIGNGTSTFNLPDLRGEFVRALDDGRNVDAGRVLGSSQAAYIPPIPRDGWGTFGSRLGTANAGRLIVGSGEAEVTEYLESIRPAGGDQTLTGDIRPRNVALLACIKY